MKEEKSVCISLKVIPRSSVNKFEKSGDEYRLKIKSPPVDGKANKEIVDFLSDYFSIPKKNIIIERGELSKNKVIRLIGISEEDINL
ncbi:MAG: DUF167 domain-containing protein [Brevinematia bacterium]